MPNLSILPSFPIFSDKNGDALESGYIYVGTAGLDAKTNAINIFFDSALTIPATQPVRTVAGYPDNNGTKAMLYTSATDFSLTVADKNNVTVYSALNITDETYKDAGQSAQIAVNTADIATNAANIATNTSNISTNTTKLATIETGADVTDATNVNAAGATMNTDTSLVGNGYFLDEDNMSSNDATKVPSQQSVKAYVDTEVASAGISKTKGSFQISSSSGSPNQIAEVTDKILFADFISTGEATFFLRIDQSDSTYVGAGFGGETSGTLTATFATVGTAGGNTIYARVTGGNVEIYCSTANVYYTYVWL